MTDDERHAIIGRAFSDRKDARDRVACLQAKKAQMVRDIDRVRDEYLKTEAPHPGSDYAIPFPTLNEVFALTTALRNARSELSDLENQCREFGLE